MGEVGVGEVKFDYNDAVMEYETSEVFGGNLLQLRFTFWQREVDKNSFGSLSSKKIMFV